MKVLLIHNYYKERGGEDVVAEREFALLERRGHDVERFFVSNDGISGLWPSLSTATLAPFNPLAQSALRQRIRQFRPDIAHVHNFFPRLSPAIFYTLKREGIPSVLSLHNFRTLCPTAVLYHKGKICERSVGASTLWAIRERVYRNSVSATAALVAMIELHKRLGTWTSQVDAFAAMTEFAKSKFVQAGFPADKIYVKGNALDLPQKSETPTQRSGALYVGRLSPEKGIEQLLDAWKVLNVPLKIVGDGPMRPLCENAANPSITFLGKLSPQSVYDEMAKAAFLVLPSVCYEMFPMTLIEAYANGLPVIASRLGAMANLVQDGNTGLLYEPADTHALQCQILWADAHKNEMAEMGRKAKNEYSANFTEAHNYEKLLQLYEMANRNAKLKRT